MTDEHPADAPPPCVVVDVRGYGTPDLVLVDVLARVRLVAGRLGARVQVLGATAELTQLLGALGLLRALAPEPPPPEAGEAPEGRGGSEGGREAEPGEEPGVEEVVDVGDPA